MTRLAYPTSVVPELDIDLFSTESLRNPFAYHRRLSDAGLVVRLRRPKFYAIAISVATHKINSI